MINRCQKDGDDDGRSWMDGEVNLRVIEIEYSKIVQWQESSRPPEVYF